MTDRWNSITDQVRRDVRRLVVVRGAAWGLAGVVSILVLAAFVDRSLSLDASVGRLSLSIGAFLGGLTILWRVLVRPLRVRLSDVEIARLVERRFRQSDDHIASAAQFRAAQQDTGLGSPELQRTTIAAADRSLQGLDVQSLFDRRPVRRAVIVASVIGVFAIAGTAAAPTTARTALMRLAMPLANVPWPRTTRLRFLDAELAPLVDAPLRTTAGEPVPLYVENELGPLPPDVTLELRLPDDATQRQSLRTTLLRDRSGASHEVGVVTLLAYRGPLQFRVRGGDDPGTPWQNLEVVVAAAAVDLTVTVTPPSYSGREPQRTQGVGLIEGLVGSRVAIEGTANKPLSLAALHREHVPQQTMTLSDDGRGFHAEFEIEEAGTSWYWFEFRDEHGLSESDPPRYELRGIADRAPVVYLEEPATDLTVAPAAEVPLRIFAQDDIGLSLVRLCWTDADAATLGAGDAAVASSLNASVQSISLPLSATGSLEESIATSWPIGPLGLSPGTQLTFWVEAVDAHTSATTPENAAGQVGKSAQRRLHVISESDKQRELAARQTGILDTLKSLRERQAQTRDMTAQLRIQAELAGRLRPADLDLLKQAEMQQQDVRREVADDASGLLGGIESLLREMAFNQLDDPEALQRLSLLAGDLSELNDRWFPTIEQLLSRARKSTGAVNDSISSEEDDPTNSQSTSGVLPEAESVPRHLQDAEEAQSTVLALLSEAAQSLGGWRERFQLSSELDSLIADQREVQRETQEIGRDTLAKSASRLTPQQQADLVRLADRQRRLASRLEQLQAPRTSTETSSGQAGRADSEGISQELRQAQAALREEGVAAEMHQAAESLQRNEIPAAAESQEAALAALRAFNDRLQHAPLLDPESLLSELQAAREHVESLHKQQEALSRDSLPLLGPTADPEREEQLQRLVKQQSELADDAEEMARTLRRQQQGAASQTADRAGRRMRDAQAAIEREQPEGVAVNQQEALDDLAQLASELDAAQNRAEGEQAARQIAELANELQLLANSQLTLRESTVDLDARQQERGSWSRPLRRELRELAGRQRGLREQLDVRQVDLQELPVVRGALAAVSEAMDQAASLLDQEKSGSLTQGAQQDAASRLTSVVEILEEEAAPSSRTPSGAESAQRGEESSQSASRPQLTAQLKLLRQMQADVNRRTSETAAAAETTSPARDALAREQGRIAELSRELLRHLVDSQKVVPGSQPEPEASP
ncbi:MAG: hypothetical protein KF861_05030 [Planctomycetaceae bacterium]|nr:hypothetical protein [Planctomycetaceae bacterium]